MSNRCLMVSMALGAFLAGARPAFANGCNSATCICDDGNQIGVLNSRTNCDDLMAACDNFCVGNGGATTNTCMKNAGVAGADGCDSGPGVPTTSEWGLAIMGLLVLSAGTLAFRQRLAMG